MEALFNRNVTGLAPSASIKFMAKAKQMQDQGLNVISLAGGEPDFDTPAPIVEEVCRQLQAGFTHYTVGQGLPELRKRIARKLLEENHVAYEDNEIIVTPGGKNAIYLAISALINPGDEVMYLDPAWVSYVPMIQANGGVAVPVVLDYDNDYRITLEALESRCTQRTKMLIINYPNNPTGKVLTRPEAELLEQFLLNHPNVILLSDEIYERIVFDGKTTVSPAAFPSIHDRVITVNGFSKSVAMTGWRLGYIIGPAAVIEAARKVHDFLTVGAAAPLQEAATVGLNFPRQYYDDLLALYTKKRDRFLAGLDAIGLKHNVPQGTYFVLLDISDFLALPRFSGWTDLEFCEWMIREIGVAAVPGSSFFKEEVNHLIRLHFARGEDVLEEAVRRLAKLKELL